MAASLAHGRRLAGLAPLLALFPREVFKRQISACFWFESDFPHPTCLYPTPVEHAMRVLAPWGPAVQRKVMSENAARLYNIPL